MPVFYSGLLTGASVLSMLQVLICCCQILTPSKKLTGRVATEINSKHERCETVGNVANVANVAYIESRHEYGFQSLRRGSPKNFVKSAQGARFFVREIRFSGGESHL